MLVREIMSSPVITIDPRATVRSAIQKLLDAKLSGLPVVDGNGALLGLLSEADLLHRSEIGTAKTRPGWLEFLLGPGRSARDYTQSHARYVEEIMTPEPITVDADATLDEAVKLMEQNRIKRLPVTSKGQMVGILSRSDLLRALLKSGKLPGAETGDMTDADIALTIKDEIKAQRWSTPDAIRVHVENGIVTLDGTIFDERERDAIRVCAENVSGVKGVIDNIVWIDPESGAFMGPPGSGTGGSF